jgi:carbon-monoxide dehydrogenase medium subunit
VIPAEFEYLAPRSLEDATRALAEHADAKIVAGGMSLIPAMKHRLSQPAKLVDIGRIPGLDGVEERRGRVRIGARTLHADLVANPALGEYPVFGETASVIGDVQVRNRGTFGGSLVHADPAADWPALFLALDGEAAIEGGGGRRTVRAEDFFVSMLTSAVGAGEVLTGLELRVERKRAGAAYAKLRQRASGFAVVGVAAQVVTDRKGRIDACSLGVTGVNAVPFRAKSLEAKLRGAEPGVDLRALCAGAEEADPMEDLHASSSYRAHLLGVFAARAVERAWERARA